MHFASWASLWFGLTLPAILVLYILKRRYTDTPVSSHLLWNRVLRESEANRPWQRLRRNLLLLLQLAAAALLVLAAMQPYVLVRGTAKGHVVLVMDLSASMTAYLPATAEGAAKPADSRLEEAKRQALADWANPGASRITLIGMGEEPELLLTEEKQPARIRNAIGNLSPSYGKTAYREALSLAAALTANDKDGEIIVYTDAQWPEAIEGLTYHVPVQLRQIGSSSSGNLAVTQFGIATSSGQEEAGTYRAVASVRNESQAERRFTLTVYAGKDPVDSREYTLGPGEQGGYAFDRLPSAETYKVQVAGSGAGDDYTLDNTLYAFPEKSGRKQVLLVTEGNLFLEKALALTGAEVTKSAPGDTPPTVKDELDFIVLDGFKPDPARTEWASLLASKPVWSLPSSSTGSPTSLTTEPPEVVDHPVTDHISFSEAHVSAVRETAAPAWSKPLITAGGAPLLLAGTENGQPRLLFTFSLQESDLPLRPEFPVLVQNAADWLSASGNQSLGRVLSGAPIDLALSAKTVSALWVRMESKDSGAMLPEGEAGGITPNGQTAPAYPGLYRLEETDAEGQVRNTYLEVVPDSAEALQTIPTPLLPGANGSPSSEVGTETDTGVNGTPIQDSNRSPLPLLSAFALAALLIIFVEWGVYRRGNTL
ncbi:BatA and WFA domain-containing protein [Gorillibacterium sp. CAU 1737]|uniref:vWA domain-containing protein n=1 Tax=Gorillibacterium sp. CAU 1737 TaxID=3140362 RepID=UPI003260AD5A